MGYRVCSALRGAAAYSLSGSVLKGYGSLFKVQCFMRSCCVQTKQSSLIYHVEIVAKEIKGVSCRVEDGFIYCVSWGRWCGDWGWLNKFSLPIIPRAMQRKYATGRPDQKDLNENLAATQGLAHMIVECNRLFEVQKPVVEMMQEFQTWM